MPLILLNAHCDSIAVQDPDMYRVSLQGRKQRHAWQQHMQVFPLWFRRGGEAPGILLGHWWLQIYLS